MQYVGKVLSTVSDFYRDLNPATLSGAVDIIVVQQKSKELKCSPFHVRFGKLQLLRPSDKAVDVIVNDVKADFCMKLGESGEAFFVLETEDDIPSDVQTSPLPSPSLRAADFEVPQYYDLFEAKRSLNHVSTTSTQHLASNRLEKLRSTNHDSFDSPTSSKLSDSLENINRSFIDDTQIQEKFWKHTRPLSVSSDTQLDFSDAAAEIEKLKNNSALLHDEWDWGVDIMNSKVKSLSENNISKSTNTFSSQDLINNKDEHENSQPDNQSLSLCSTIANDISSLFDPMSDLPVKVSLCSIDTINSLSTNQEKLEAFEKNLVSQDQFINNPLEILQNEDSVFLLNGNFYKKSEFSNLIISWILFKAIPAKVKEPLLSTHLGDNMMSNSYKDDDSIDSPNKLFFLKSDRLSETEGKNSNIPQTPESSWRWWKSSKNSQTKKNITLDSHESTSPNSSISTPSKASSGFQQLSPTLHIEPQKSETSPSKSMVKKQDKYFAKTLRLTSSQLESLNLKMGHNTVVFRIQSGKGYCEANIFMYSHDSQLVISDIDGTITKSDALGHLFNMVGRDWTHTGVAKLYTEISKNQYEFLYLTSRAIGQADTTREYLKNVKQGSHILPKGPLLLSPDRLFASFHREVIKRKPHEFKMACLGDIKKLFENDTPFYAGFGNRITDAMSYVSVNVPPTRICTIDPNGDVKFELLLNYKSSYPKMGDLVDLIFPPLKNKINSDFNDFSFWRSPLPVLDDDLDFDMLTNSLEQKNKKSPKSKLLKYPTEVVQNQVLNIKPRPQRSYTISNKVSMNDITDIYSDNIYHSFLNGQQTENTDNMTMVSGNNTSNAALKSMLDYSEIDSEFIEEQNNNSATLAQKIPIATHSTGTLLSNATIETSLISASMLKKSSASVFNSPSDSISFFSKSVDRPTFDDQYYLNNTIPIRRKSSKSENIRAHNNSEHLESFSYSLPNIHHLKFKGIDKADSNNEALDYFEKNSEGFLQYKYNMDDEDDIDSMSSLSDKIDLNDFPYL
ncbi:hypothetical protein BB561_004924 [Smittium simulii]|uniref:phosphatidate phosphatase n=1 Tax=Smittium simulii TaxID=133385 RepID=A0A2T9YDB4_9FUNG|nr:hypothetical protein BB561_004924 [Smittium simulii]